MRIKKKALNKIIEHANRSVPEECCGLLMAAPDQGYVSLVLPADNEETTEPGTRYMLGHQAYLRAIEMEVQGKARIAGVYHSHPGGGPAPSGRDRELAHPGLVYLIVSPGGNPARHMAWKLGNHGLEQEPVEVTE